MNAAAQSPIDSGQDLEPGTSQDSGEKALIQAKHFMTANVVTVGPEMRIREVAVVLKEHNIGAVPVVDDNQSLVGIISKGDVTNRQELGIESLTGKVGTSHGLLVQDVMTRDLITVSEQTSFADVAEIQQEKHIKHLPVVRDEKLVGIVSRTDVVRVLSERPEGAGAPTSSDDDVIRLKVIETLMDMLGGGVSHIDVTVSQGVVELQGTVLDEAKHGPSRQAVERIPHVLRVDDQRVVVLGI